MPGTRANLLLLPVPPPQLPLYSGHLPNYLYNRIDFLSILFSLRGISEALGARRAHDSERFPDIVPKCDKLLIGIRPRPGTDCLTPKMAWRKNLEGGRHPKEHVPMR